MFYPEYTNSHLGGKKVILLGMSNILMFYTEYTNTAILEKSYFAC